MASSSDNPLEKAPSKLKIEKNHCSKAHTLPYILCQESHFTSFLALTFP